MNITRLPNIAVLLILSFWLAQPPQSQGQCALPNGIIFVSNTLDEGPGSLREAIHCANNTPGPNTIRFNIVSLQDQIFMVGTSTMEPLPPLTDDGTVIDGSTQAGFGLNADFTPKIILDGSGVDWDLPVNGLTILSDGFGVYGLEIRNFPYNGIEIRNGDDGRIGDPQRMNIIYSNGEERDIYPLAPVTGMYNGSGIFIRSSSTNVTIENNIIGSDETLSAGKGNEWAGIRSVFNSFNNFIGNNEEGRRNTILHNPTGVLLVGSVAQRVSGNLFLCNDTAAISMLQNSNGNKPAPLITSPLTSGIGGTAQNNSVVEVYISQTDSCPDAVCQGSIYLGSAEVTGGTWHLAPPYHNGLELTGGEAVTALAVDLSPISANTSPFSSCRTVIDPALCATSQGEVFVTQTGDGGIGSLRYAIGCANAVAGPNTILFDIPEDQLTPLFVGETTGDPLPTLTDAGTIIDGTTQPGGRPVLDGSLTNWDIPHNALFIRADSCGIFGMEIRNFPDDGIDITNASRVRIGRPGGGNIIHSNGSAQDEFPGLPGTGPWEGSAIVLKGTTQSCVIQSNHLGTNTEGQVAPNEFAGIRIRQAASGHIIGGAGIGEQNTITGHPFGITLESTVARCDMHANSIVCNTLAGIELQGLANQEMLPPVIDSAREFTFKGTLPTNAQRVDLYAQPELCASLPCQGSLYLASTQPSGSSWSVDNLLAPIPPGAVSITATSTDQEGNTSEFALCIPYERQCDGFQAPGLVIQPDNCFQGTGSISLDPADPLSSSTYIYEIRAVGGNPPTPPATPLMAGTYQTIIADMQGCADTMLVDLPNQDEPPIAHFNFSRQGLDVMLSNTTEHADSFFWSFGDGTTSDLPDPVHTFPAAGTYEICLTAFGPCGEDIFCQSVFVLEEDRTPVFRVGTASGQPGDTVSVLVTTLNFTDIIGFQFSVEIADTTKGTIASVGEFQIQGLDQSNFILAAQNLALSWFDFGLNGLSVPDETILFEIKVALKDNFSGCVPLLFSDSPTPAEVILFFDGEDSKAPFILHDGEVCRPGSAQGAVRTPLGLPVGQVAIVCGGVSADTTMNNGQYICNFQNLTPPITLRPEKLINARNGVSTFDMLRIQQHILKFDTFTDPYQIIAANADGSNKVSTIDLVHIQQVILNIASQFPSNSSWRFVPADYNFPFPSAPLAGNYPQEVVFASSGIDTFGIDFTGIKIGDVTQDNDPAEAAGHPPFTIQPVLKTDPNDATLMAIELTADQGTKWSAIQGTLQYDPDVLELLSVSNNPATLLVMNTTHSEPGQIPFLWWDEEIRPAGRELGKELLATLYFRLLAPQTDVDPILSICNHPTEAFAISGSGQRREILVTPPSLVTSTINMRNRSPKMICSPNPFTDYLNISVESPESTPAVICIFDEIGRMISSKDVQLETGINTFELKNSLTEASSGILVVEVRSTTWSLSSQVVRQ